MTHAVPPLRFGFSPPPPGARPAAAACGAAQAPAAPLPAVAGHRASGGHAPARQRGAVAAAFTTPLVCRCPHRPQRWVAAARSRGASPPAPAAGAGAGAAARASAGGAAPGAPRTVTAPADSGRPAGPVSTRPRSRRPRHARRLPAVSSSRAARSPGICTTAAHLPPRPRTVSSASARRLGPSSATSAGPASSAARVSTPIGRFHRLFFRRFVCTFDLERARYHPVAASPLPCGRQPDSPARLLASPRSTSRFSFDRRPSTFALSVLPPYGTLPGHPESGEEAFTISNRDDGLVVFTITAFSRPATIAAHAAGPLGPLIQRHFTQTYLRALARGRGGSDDPAPRC